MHLMKLAPVPNLTAFAPDPLSFLEEVSDTALKRLGDDWYCCGRDAVGLCVLATEPDAYRRMGSDPRKDGNPMREPPCCLRLGLEEPCDVERQGPSLCLSHFEGQGLVIGGFHMDAGWAYRYMYMYPIKRKALMVYWYTITRYPCREKNALGQEASRMYAPT